jgi:hypothetical protein
MISCLQLYLDSGLLKANLVNQALKSFMSSTSNDFAEWCGVFGNTNELLRHNDVLHVNKLYFDFTEEYPDYAPRSKFTWSRQYFFKCLVEYSKYKYKCTPVSGRDSVGKWIKFVNKSHYNKQTSIEL